jgi:hypothetical protein
MGLGMSLGEESGDRVSIVVGPPRVGIFGLSLAIGERRRKDLGVGAGRGRISNLGPPWYLANYRGRSVELCPG